MKHLKLYEEFFHKVYNRLPEGSKIIINNSIDSVYIVDKNYKILSGISLGIRNGEYYVGGVASNQDLRIGVLIYEFIMMNVYPKSLMPSRDGDVRGGAMYIWEQFYNNREDVKKETLDIKDEDYSFSILSGDDYYMSYDEKLEYLEEIKDEDIRRGTDDNIKVLNIFNSKYYLEPNTIFNKLKVDWDILPKNIQNYITKQDEDFFINKYE